MSLRCRLLFVVCATLLGSSSLAATWSTSTFLNPTSDIAIKDPHVCPAAGGGFHAMYKPSSPVWQIKYRRYQGGSYSTPTVVPITGWPGGFADIGEAGNGDIWVTWENWAESAEREQIWAARSVNSGQSWTTWNTTQYQYGAGEDGQAKNPNICAYGPAGSATVVASNARAVHNELTYAAFNGSTWSPTVGLGVFTDNFYSNYGICRHPIDGSVYRTYGREIDGVWQMCMRRFDGASWGPELVVSNNPPGSEYIARPSIAISYTGRIMVVWDQVGMRSREYDPAVGWRDQLNVGDGWQAVVTAMPGRNEFYMVWSDNSNVKGKRYRASSWEPTTSIVSVGQPNAYTYGPDLCACPDGMLVSCWENHAAGGPYAYHSMCTDFAQVDATASPAPASVVDDGSATDSTSDLHCMWSPVTDPESGIDRYEYSIGTTAGAYNVRYWSYAGSGTELYAHGLSLTPGVAYYINIRAVNRAGKEGALRSTDGILCDPAVNATLFGVTIAVSTSSAACDQPMLAPSAAGGMHLTYREASGSSYRVDYRRLTGDTWGATELASNINPSSYFPDVAEEPAGNVHVVFANPGGRESNDLYESIRTAGGWSAPAFIGGYGTLDWYPKLAPGVGSNQVHLVVNGDNATYNVKHAVRTSGGWSAFESIGTGAMASTRYGIPDVATDSAGNVSVVWTGSNTDVRFCRRTGTTWFAPVTLASHPGAFMCYPRIAVGLNGYAHVVYADHNVSPDPAIYYIRQTGPTTWTAPQLIANGYYPAIAVDASSHAHVVYGKGLGGNPDIYHKVFTGSTWSYEQNLSSNAGVSERPALRVDTDGALHVAWQDNTTGTYRVLWRKTVPEPPTCAYAKRQQDGTGIELRNKVVSAVFTSDNAFYIQEPNRTSGMRVQGYASGRAVGEVVNVTGSLATRMLSGVDSERQISASSVGSVVRGTPPFPLAMVCRSVGGARIDPYIPGVTGGVGANNMGLLVKITGRVMAKSGSNIWVDDGSKIADPFGYTGVMVKCPSTPSVVEGNIVSVTGVIEGSVFLGTSANRRLVRMRDLSDIKVF